ncbi:hypothetical protein [Chryseobacterium sp. MEBOG07]|uniref:hypothetical protein n=1 Tax=Chryseobacterium sp. MEBOG07 TaxID=2879939 RepID=UPI001F29943C|nr:hypothetical protein [Chryseobacterium sp. MEBOG07]UKB81186.1 hypothetical protein LF886_09420 [Chryseobacterium sp. MEBOG07]
MEKDNLTTRDKLKTYFETGKYPTQNQFSDLIDSLKLKGDILTNKEAVIIANGLNGVLMNNASIAYYAYNIQGKKFLFTISSADKEDQVITIDDNPYNDKKYYLFGNGPYVIKAKELPTEGLGGTEYYSMMIQIDDYAVNRLFGNTLPKIPEGFVFGTLKGKRGNVHISGVDAGQKLNVVNTNIKFINKTQVPVQYTLQGNYWSSEYTDKDIVTDHYDAWDSLYLYLRADLQGINQSIECKVYDADHNKLLTTAYFEAGQSNQSVSGGEIKEIRNVRIECNYAVIGK